MILKLLVPQQELHFFLKMIKMNFIKLLSLKLCKVSAEEKHCKHLENRTRNVGFEYSGSRKKEIRARHWEKHFWGLEILPQSVQTLLSLWGSRGRLYQEIPSFLFLREWKCTSFLRRTFTSMTLENFLYNLRSHTFSYRRQQSSFPILGMAKMQSPISAQADNRASTSVMPGTPHSFLLWRTGLNISHRRFLLQSICQKCGEKESLYALGTAAFPASSPSNWEKKGSN